VGDEQSFLVTCQKGSYLKIESIGIINVEIAACNHGGIPKPIVGLQCR